MPLDIHSTQTQNLTFDTLFNSVNKESTKYDDKSLRLYKTPDQNMEGANELQLKVHTGTSSLGHSTARDTRRQDALDLVRNSILTQFQGNETVVNRILSKVPLAKQDRISLGELKQLKQVVNAEVARSQDFETLMANSLEGNTDTNEMLQALDRFQGAFPTGNDARAEVGTLKLMEGRTAKDLLDKGLRGTDQEQQTVVDKLKVAVTALRGNRWIDCGGDQNRTTAALRVRAGLLVILEDIQQQVLTNQFDRRIGNQTDQKKQEWTDLMQTGQSHITTQQDQQNFNNKTMDQLLEDPNWSIARSGGSGSIFVGNVGSEDRSVLKINEQDHVIASQETTNYINSVAQRLPHNEVSFETMMVKELDIQQVSGQLSGKLQQMNTDADPNDTRTKEMTQQHVRTLGELENQHPLRDGLMMCSVISNAQDLNKLPVVDRFALCKTDTLPQDLGKAMVFGRLFGLDDHANITSKDGAFGARNSNISNLMMNKDTGKLVFIDFQLVPRGRTDNKSGYSEEQVTMAYDALAKFMNDINDGNIDEELDKIVREIPGNDLGNPLTSLMRAMFKPGDDGMFTEDDKGALSRLTPQDRARFAVNLMLGAIEAFKTISNHPDAFTAGQPMFDNPQNVTDHVTQLNQGLNGAEQTLRNYLQTH